MRDIYNQEALGEGDISRTMACIHEHAPVLLELGRASTLEAYAKQIWDWQPDNGLFPFRRKLQGMIVEKVGQFYGDETAAGIDLQLSQNFVVNTGPHISLPRDLDAITSEKSPNRNVNTLIFQGLVYMAALAKAQGHKYSIGFLTGRITPGNPNSARYFQPTAQKDSLYALVGKDCQGPQTFIPALDSEALQKKCAAILSSGKMYPRTKARIRDVFDALGKAGSNFSDQAGVAHAYLMNEVFSGAGVEQVTVNSDEVTWDFVADLLDDPDSLLHGIFSDPHERFVRDTTFNIWNR